MMVLDIIDLNSDQRDDLVIPSIKIGVAQIIKMLVTRSVSIEASYYLMREDGRYPEKPDGSNTLTVKFAFKGGAASPVYEIDDFNNDGLFDVLSSSDEERLLIYWGEQGKFIQAGAGEKFSVQLPQDGTLVRAADLNGDHRADVIIGYDDDDRERKSAAQNAANTDGATGVTLLCATQIAADFAGLQFFHRRFHQFRRGFAADEFNCQHA